MKEYKICTRCKEKKENTTEFFRLRKDRGTLQTICRNCEAKRSAEWMKKNPFRDYSDEQKQKRYEYAARWREKNKDKIKQYSRKSDLKRRFELSLEDYNKMLEEQDGGCIICGKTKEENKQNLSVDHDHESGKIRGLLCDTCNRGLGYFKDDPELIINAAKYLKKN